MLKKIATIAGVAMIACATVPANAATVTLNFTGIATGADATTVGGFYNGGTSGDGTSGTDFGVAFTNNALAINSYNGANEPTPGILFFLDGGSVGLDYASGFKTSLSFYYAAGTAASFTIYSGLGGTGAVLATASLASNTVASCGYCQWDKTTVSFSGIARSIDFAGSANNVGFDQLTFETIPSDVAAVPEPASWALLLAGFATMGTVLRRRGSVTLRDVLA